MDVTIRGEYVIISMERVVLSLRDLSRHSLENTEESYQKNSDDRYGLKLFNLPSWRRIYTERTIAHRPGQTGANNGTSTARTEARQRFQMGTSQIQIYIVITTWGARGGVVVKAISYKPAGRGFDSRWCHSSFSVT